MASLDLELVRHALRTAQEHAYSEVEVGIEGASFRARFEPGQGKRLKTFATVESDSIPISESEAKAIKSPLVGFFHFSSSPLVVGGKVSKGDVVGVVNALGIANDIESQLAGEITEVLVKDDQAVEFGQVLAKVKG